MGFIRAAVAWLLLCSVALAQVPLTFAGSGAPGGGACSPDSNATTWLGRVSGGLSAAETKGYCLMINKMDTDSTWSLGDVFYIFATNNSTTALLNILSTSFTATIGASTCTFTADANYQCDAVSGWISTNYNPSTNGVNYTLNSAGMLAYITNSRTGTGNSWCSLGVSDSSSINYSYIAPNNGASGYQDTINTGGDIAAGQTNAQGFWAAMRTGANATASYKNSNTTPIATGSAATGGAIPNGTFRIAACSFSGGAPSNFSGDQIAAIWIGTGLTATQMKNLQDAINLYMTQIGINLY